MLGISTSQNINHTNSGFASANQDRDQDPLFHDDWLHEHNLDILFDLFEEELEGKDLDTNDANSSTIFGSSPVTSYLFGTSPSLASTLDLYDLLYFDNQQPITSIQQQHHHFPSSSSSVSYHRHHHHQQNQTGSNNVSKLTVNNLSKNQKDKKSETSCCSSKSHRANNNVSSNRVNNSITNAMKIKRRSKKGQSEGVSLLARPSNKNNVHYVTGYAVIREHAYAARGH